MGRPRDSADRRRHGRRPGRPRCRLRPGGTAASSRQSDPDGGDGYVVPAALDGETVADRVVAVAETVCVRYREDHPEATMRFGAPAEVPTVYADGLLERAVDAVVENALEHHQRTPTVEVRIEPVDDRWVDVVVATTARASPTGSGRY